jgi:hypothetical protein
MKTSNRDIDRLGTTGTSLSVTSPAANDVPTNAGLAA